VKIVEQSENRLILRSGGLFGFLSREIVMDKMTEDITIDGHQHISAADVKAVCIDQKLNMWSQGTRSLEWQVFLKLRSGKQLGINTSHDLQEQKDLATRIRSFIKSLGYADIDLVDRSYERRGPFTFGGGRQRYGRGR